MSLNNMFYEAAVARAASQAKLIDKITEKAPLLAATPMQEATDDIAHLYEEVTAITAAATVDLDAALPEVNMDTVLKQQDLTKFGGRMEVGEDKARRMGGPQAYFQRKLPKVLAESAALQEAAMFGTNIRDFSFDNSKAINSTGTGNVYTIYCVTWEEDEITGLFSPNGPGDGKVFEISPLNGGNRYLNSSNVAVYGATAQLYFGLLLANDRYVSTIDNVTSTKVPTEAMLDDVILNARGQVGGNTVLYMHPQARNYLYTYKNSALQVTNQEIGKNRVTEMWNGIPILTSYNLGLQTAKTFS